MTGGSHIVANLRAAAAGSFRGGRLGEDGAFQAVSGAGGLRGWLVNRMESGNYRANSWQGRAIKALVGGEENFRAIQAALRENREASLANASRLLLDESMVGPEHQDRAALTEHLAGNLLDIVRTRGSATAKFETIQEKVRDFARMRQSQRENAQHLAQLENEARRQADSAVQARQTAPSGSTPRSADAQHKTGKVTEGLPLKKPEFAGRVGGPRAARVATLNAELNRQLDDYAAALNGAVTSRTPEQRAQTAAALNARLDEIEATVMAVQAEFEHDEIEFTTPTGRPPGGLEPLQTRLDEQRALVIDVANNFGAGHAGTAGNPVTWGQALQLKRLGLNVGANVATSDYQGKQLRDSKTLGQGSFNIVYKLTFEDGSVGVFKPGKALDNPAHRPVVSTHAGIPRVQPRYEARSIASPRLDEMLETGLLVKTGFYEHQGKMGILMEQAQGKTMYDFIDDWQQNDFPPALHRDVNKLQLLDAVTGQLDRHGDNVMVETDAQGNYAGLKGIDNDTSFGADAEYNELDEFQNWAYNPKLWDRLAHNRAYKTAAANSSGLPPVADAGLAAKILAPGFADQARSGVEGLLSPEETERLGERIMQVQDHLRALQRKGLLVADWDSGKTTGGASILETIRNDDVHSQSVAWGILPPRQRKP